MSDVEKAFAANKYDTSGGHSAVALQQRPQQQYYIKPTITANTHYCHDTGHIKTSPLTGSVATASSTLPRRGRPNQYTNTKSKQAAPPPPTRSASPPSSTASVASSSSPSSSVTAGSGCPSLGHNNCLGLILKLIFSTPGLVVLVVAYSIMGAFIFPLLEAPQDLTKSAAIAKSREDCLRELWIITEKLNVLYERNWTMLVHEQLRRFEGSIVAATRHGGNAVSGGGGGVRSGIAVRQDTTASATAVGRFGGHSDGLEDASRWSFSEALLYSVTVITTIGHGSLTPKTAAGKIATILYALIGVPLMLMCLSSLGSLLAEALQCTYARICCRLSATTTTTTTVTTTTKAKPTKATEKKPILRKGSKRQRRYNSDGDVRAEKKLQHGGESVVETSGSECHGKAHTLDSKGCKYDALPNNGYNEYNVTNNPTLVGHNEESCHLLQHQSPIRTNQHNVGCMQQQLQQQQQQYYQQQQQNHQTLSGQQRPDVMLMAHQPQHYNRSATPSPQHTYHHQQQQQQHYHQQQQQQYQITASPPPPTTTATATPSTMQTFHLVTSTGSGPTAYTSPPLLPSSSSSPSSSTQATTSNVGATQLTYTSPPRHFVAVPSGLIRFPPNTSTNTNTADTSANANANALTMDGAAPTTTTIYFPISSSGGAVISAAPPAQVAFMAAASSGVVASTTATVAVAGHSPFVKYHTIQFQPKKPYIVAANNDVVGGGGSSCPLVPLPPPPAYQTATVHGVRRAKFLTKPLPQEINNLLADNDIDISCRHDLSQSSCTRPGTQATAAPPDAVCQSGIGSGGGGSNVAATSALLLGSSTTTVDIMEDEEENEQDRMGCPHGTPSRIPLISSNSSASQYGVSNDYAESMEKSTRSGGGLINATAASFHRHTLHTFQRKANAAASSSQRRQPQGRADNRRRRRTKRHSCYGDPAETSDDGDDNDNVGVEYQPRGGGMANEQFVLTQIDSHGRVTGTSTELDDNDDDDDDDDDDVNGDVGSGFGNGRRHVPIILVLGILICYICLGTLIFAFWENWSLIDGAYFCFVTLATIGYGDFLPERTFNGPEVQLFACCAYLLLGLVLVAMSFSILETQLLWKCKRIAVRLKLATD